MELGHHQPPTPIQTDNKHRASGIANDKVKQKDPKLNGYKCFLLILRLRVNAKASTSSTGKGKPTGLTTSPSIIPLPIIKQFDQCTPHANSSSRNYFECLSMESKNKILQKQNHTKKIYESCGVFNAPQAVV
jgi:hypothetical protein